MSGDRLRRGVWDSAYEYYGARPCDGGWVFRVWAPQARCVALSGDFNEWQRWDMHRLEDGTWELTVENARQFDGYQYVVTQGDGREVWKSDPYGFHQETRPSTNSKLYDIGGYTWHDEKWRQRREGTHPAEGYVNIYEVHLGSWRRTEDGQVLNYRDMADQLALYVRDMGYNYVELLPVTEYPLDDSWGYQCVGYFAPTSRYGTPHDFMYLVDRLHRAGIGVILDWVPAHFCKDSHGLIQFDGSCLYEYSDPLKWEHESWGTRVFDFGKPEVCSFLLSSAAYWLREYHIDGLRVDAVASMLYLDYDRKDGEWTPNRNGGKENLEAIEFLRSLNRTAFAADPNVLMIAEESTAWPLVTRPPEAGGLGFNLKWNMGWMNDMCHYLKLDPYFRQYHHKDITFSMMYAFSENYVLPISHDEVVHMKGSLVGKMPGDYENQLRSLRGFYAYLLAHPGKKLMFMGPEIGQWHEWDANGQLDWYLLDQEPNRQTLAFFRAANRFYQRSPELWQIDFDWRGFEWLVPDDNHNNVVVFLRRDERGRDLLCAVNFSPNRYEGYRVGVPAHRKYTEVFNTDAPEFGGGGWGNGEPVPVERVGSHGKEFSVQLRIPPFGGVFLRGEGKTPAAQAAKGPARRSAKKTARPAAAAGPARRGREQ